MNRKYLYALLICFSLIFATVPRVLSSDANSCIYHPEAYRGLEIPNLSEELTSTGLIGRIHGAADASRMFVMAVREPDNFFSHREFSLISADESTSNTLGQLNRHDLVCVKGNIIANPSPQKHIALSSVKLLEAWQQPDGFAPYERQVELPEKLRKQTSLIGKVHAISAEGKILVMGYQDLVLPVYVMEPKHTKNLYRGDIVKLKYQVQSNPQRPLHLQLDSSAKQPLEMIDAIATINNKPQTLTGKLVKFPQSPQLKFDVYAMEVNTNGIERYFTIVNFDDMNKFKNIRQKLAKIWDDNSATAISGRNMLINPEVTIQATGLGNIISPEQANPQILMESAEQIKQIS